MKNGLIVFNWKMNPAIAREARVLFSFTALETLKNKREVVVAAPSVYLGLLKGNRYVKLAAQDVFYEESGPFTGEISPGMLKSLGVNYVIIGHSERRALGEKDEEINKKIKMSLSAGLKPILCVGERREGGQARKFVRDQLEEDLRGARGEVIVAYEPVYAISTSGAKRVKEEKVEEMGKYIKSAVRGGVKVLYGGSVTSQNMDNYVSLDSIDGVLVGGASLKKSEIKKILKN